MALFGQLTQSEKYDVARAGMTVGNPNQFNINAQCVVETSAIEFGTFCSRDDAEDKVHPPTSANDVTLYGMGFAKRDASKGFDDAGDYGVGDAIPIVKSGPGMWVKVAADVTPVFSDPVYVRHGATSRGCIAVAAGTGDTAGTRLPHCRVERYVASLSIALISMDNASAVGPTGPTGPTGPGA